MPGSRTSGSHGFNFKRCLCAPLRLLSRLLDAYVTNMNKLADQLSYDATFGGCPSYGSCPITIPRNFGLRSNCSSIDDNELVKAASEKNNNKTAHRGVKNVHNRSAAITRIDEDEVCEFEDCDLNLGLRPRYMQLRLSNP